MTWGRRLRMSTLQEWLSCRVCCNGTCWWRYGVDPRRRRRFPCPRTICWPLLTGKRRPCVKFWWRFRFLEWLCPGRQLVERFWQIVGWGCFFPTNRSSRCFWLWRLQRGWSKWRKKYLRSIAWEHVLGHEQHFPVENFVSENEVTDQTGIWVWNVEWLVDDDVRIWTQSIVEGVVLEMSGVQMGSSVLIYSVISDDFGEVVHSEEIGIVPAWGDKGSTDWGVGDFIVSLEHEWWGKVGLLFVGDLSFNMSLGWAEMLADQIVKLCRVNFSSAWNDDVLSDVELIMELLHLVGGDGVGVFSDTSAWLTEVMVSEGGVVDHLKSVLQGIHWSGVLVDSWLKSLHLHWFVSGLEDDFWQEVDCIAELSLVKEQSVSADLSSDVDLEDASESVDPFLDLLLWQGLSASQSSVGNELSHWTVFKSLLSAACFDVDSDGSLMTRPEFSSDSDTVAKFIDGGGSWSLESFRNFAKG